MEELKPCQCGGEAEFKEQTVYGARGIRVRCKKCKIGTIVYEEGFRYGIDGKPHSYEECKETAASVWNLRAVPENKPLSLEQIRQMDGEPVWISEQKNGGQDTREQWQQFAYEESEYGLMAFWEFGSEVENTYDTADYDKNWLAFAHKPEGAETK